MENHHRTKQALTLIEILLALTLIGLVCGALSLQLPKVLKSNRFEHSIDQLKQRIYLAQEIMLNCHTDVLLELTIDPEKGLFCQIQPDASLSEQFIKHVNRNPYIPGIESMLFDHVATDTVQLVFEESLGTAPKGVLVLHGMNQTTSIIFKGFPSYPHKNHEIIPDAHACYPQEILSFV